MLCSVYTTTQYCHIQAYSSFAFKRVTAFEGGMHGVTHLIKSKKTSEKDATATLTTIASLIASGLKVKVITHKPLNAAVRFEVPSDTIACIKACTIAIVVRRMLASVSLPLQ
jgi:hypothetical protein